MENLCFPQRMIYGKNSSVSLPEYITGTVAVLFSTASRQAERVADLLRKKGCVVRALDAVSPMLSCVRRVAAEVSDCNWIVAVGGVSELDAAKAIRVFSEQPALRPEQLLEETDTAYLRHRIGLAAVPTTADTATGVTRYGVISDETRPYFCANSLLIPDYVWMDATLLEDVTREQAAFSALDAFVNALESFVSKGAQPFMEGYALEAIRLTDAAFDGVLHGETSAMESLMYAHCLGSLAFSNGELGAAHALAHASQGVFSLPHGVATAMALPHVIRFNAGYADYMPVAKILALTGNPADALAHHAEQMSMQAGAARSFQGAGVIPQTFEAMLPELARRAMADGCMAWNPRTVTYSDAEQLLCLMQTGGAE